MEQTAKDLWVDVTAQIFIALCRNSQAVGDVRRNCTRAIERFVATGRLDPDALGTAGARALADASPRFDDRPRAEVRAILCGHAVATGDFSAIPRAERADLARLLGKVPVPPAIIAALLAAPAPAPSPALAAPLVVQAALAYRVGAGHGGTSWLGRVPVEVPLVDPADAPVVCRLGTVGGGSLDLRFHAGRYLRPVLSPGTWEAITVGGFLEAAAGGVPWLDSPFNPGNKFSCATPAILSCAQPTLVETPRRRQALADTAASRARVHGGFVAIEGVVYRQTGVPTLDVRLRRSTGIGTERLEVVVAWSLLDDIDSTDDMRTLSTWRDVGVPAKTNLAVNGKLTIAHLWNSGRFAIADMGHAVALADTFRTLPAEALKDTAPVTPGDPGLFAVEVVDPSLLPSPSPSPRLASFHALLADLDDAALSCSKVRYEAEGADALPREVFEAAGRAAEGDVDALTALQASLERTLPGVHVTEDRSVAPVMAAFGAAALEEISARLALEGDVSSFRL